MTSAVDVNAALKEFSMSTELEWLRNSLWCTSRFDIVPHDSHLQLSRRRICWCSLSYAKEWFSITGIASNLIAIRGYAGKRRQLSACKIYVCIA